MKQTTLILTSENKKYLVGFLTDYLIQCNEQLNETSQHKLAQLIGLLMKNED